MLKVVRKHSALSDKEQADKKKARERDEQMKIKKLEEKKNRVFLCSPWDFFLWLTDDAECAGRGGIKSQAENSC